MRLMIGIDGFCRMGRSDLGAGWGRAGIAGIQVREVATDAAASVHQRAFRLPKTGLDH